MTTRVLGIDPGLTRCGLAVVDILPGRKVKYIAVETATSSPKSEIDVRISDIAGAIENQIQIHKPSLVAIERVFAQANLRSVMGVAQISGVAIFIAAKHGIPLQFHTPSEVKAAVTGNGRANKQQVALMVSRLLGLTDIPKPADSADALAIAITAGWRPESASQPTGLTKAQRQWATAAAASKISS